MFGIGPSELFLVLLFLGAMTLPAVLLIVFSVRKARRRERDEADDLFEE